MKESSIGRQGSKYGIEEFLEVNTSAWRRRPVDVGDNILPFNDSGGSSRRPCSEHTPAQIRICLPPRGRATISVGNRDGAISLSISNTSFEEISELDLQALIDAGVSEGHLIEYKGTLYDRNDEQVKEFLKDASSFENTYGGHLLIGMEESEGVASRIAQICGVDVDAEIARLENLLRDGLEPRVLGIRVRAVAISPIGAVIVVRVPRSWNPPHRVKARNWNRVFARNSAGAHEMSMEELRASFAMAASAYDRARAFRSERNALIDALETPIPIVSDPDRLVLHLVPLAAFGLPGSKVDLNRAGTLLTQLMPIGAHGGFNWRINYEGFITYRPTDPSHGYTQVFRNGLIEAVFTSIVYENQEL